MGSIEQRLLCLEQFAVAIDELRQRDSVHGRLAHILIDNAVELMLHFQAEAVISNKWRYSEVIPKNEKHNDEALGQSFAPKVSFARKIGTLTAHEADYVLINHNYRNQLYHVGIAHGEVIHALAAHYCTFALGLISRFKFGLSSFSIPLLIPHRLELLWESKQSANEDRLGFIASKLAEESATMAEPLNQVLSQSLLRRIDRLDKSIDWIVRYDPERRSRTMVILDSQLWSALGDKERLAQCRLLISPSEYERRVRKWAGDPIHLLRSVLATPIRNDPIPRWRTRGDELKSEVDSCLVVKKYDGLMSESGGLYEDIMKTGGALENHLEYLRGK
jgi:hypothetical protein